MAARNSFSCYVIGETSLTVQCCEKLLERGHTICGIVTPNPDITAWAGQRGIPFDLPPHGLNGFMQERPFDYLFSIVNNAVLPAELLQLPRRMAINFHDAPLPRYGGIHATSWAIMNREKAHGITWHVMTPQVDGGGVLKQREIAVAPSDTALSLNLRCYQKAAEAFGELIDELAGGTAEPRPQDLSKRTYFSRYRRPALGCLIDWNGSAAEIEAFVRGLEFGPYPNALGVPKVQAGGEYAIINSIQVLESRSCAAPGTVMEAGDRGLTVATADFDVLVTAAARLDGSALVIGSFAREAGIRPGYRFTVPEGPVAERLTGLYGEMCRHEAFWHAELRGLQPLALPDLRLRAGAAAPGQLLYRLDPPPELVGTAMHLIPGAKPWQILCALFGAFLGRHTGMGAVHLGLHDELLDEATDGLEGFFAGCLPLRLDIDPQQPLAACCRASIDKLSALGRRGTYARDLVARYPDLRAQAGLKLPLRVKHVRSLESVRFDTGAAIELAVADQGGCTLCVNTGEVDPAYGESIKKQLSAFLAGAAADFARPLACLPLADPSQCREMIEGWNDTAAPFAGDICMHELFERRALEHPEAAATVFNGTGLSYGELNLRANRLAWRLKRAGAGRGSLVGICLDRSHDMIAALLAVFKAGGAYVPLDPSYPAERAGAIVRGAGISVIVSQRKHERLASHEGVRNLMIDAPDSERTEPGNDENPPRAAQPGDLAYVIYTSGSTGAPKGVMISHRPFINLFEWCCRTSGFGPGDTVLFTTSLGFDLSVFDIFGMLGCGGRIYIAGDAERKDPARLADLLCTQDITFWDSAPAALQLLMPALKARPKPVANSRLRLVFLSGDWIPVTLPDELREVFPGARVMSLGGATEATVWSNFFPVNRVEPHWRSIPYGRPIQNSRYYILDERLQPCPPAVTGDLYIAGECLSSGYRNEPDLTARSFVEDPFRAGCRMYRTGDLARYFPDGTMEFLGRSDFQVKVRGYRIELGEIEHVLRGHPAVKEAVSLVRQGAAGDQKIVAYLTRSGLETPASKELRGHAARHLAEYMVPNMFVWLDAMPATANGKLDRSRLPWPVEQQPAQAAETVAAQPSAEPAAAPARPAAKAPAADVDLTAALGVFFSGALGGRAPAADEDFFDLGVTSLNLIQIAERINEELGIEVTVEAFLDHPTLASLASHIFGQNPGLACPRQETPSAGSLAAETCSTIPAPAPGQRAAAPVKTVLRGLQITLPAEAFLDPAVLAEVTARVRLAFGDNALHAGSIQHPAAPRQTAPPAGQAACPIERSPASDPLATELAACFREVLKIPAIGPDADFFDLGVTSLNLIEIAELLRERLGIDVPVELFLDHTTLASLALRLKDMAPDGRPSESAPVQARGEQPAGSAAQPLMLAPIRIAGQEYEKSLPCRSFAPDPVPLQSLGRLLALLKQEMVAGEPKYLYPSAGGLNAVQAYVFIRKGRVSGVPGGIYYYHPQLHELQAVAAPADIPDEIMRPTDRALFGQAGFCLFFIAQLAALRPVYDCLSPALAVLDSGYMLQLLMSRQQSAGLGLCPLPGADFERVRSLFSLDPGHLFTACIAGGLSGTAADARSGEPVAGWITGHFAGPAPDWSCLHAVAAGKLDCLNVLTPQQHEELHRSQPHLRRVAGSAQAVKLPAAGYLHNQFLVRSTQRSFSRRPVPARAFSQFLCMLRPGVQGAPLYHALTAPGCMELYLQVQPQGVEGVGQGIYRYSPDGHGLTYIGDPPPSDVRQCHFPRNRAYFTESGFSLFCLADTARLQLLYGPAGLELAMLEAGALGQALMDHQAETGMGLCPIGALRFEGLRAQFGLGQHQQLLHSFLCGPVDRPAQLLSGIVPLAIDG